MSYPRETGQSVNQNTPKEDCTVKYPDFYDAIQLCIKAGKLCKILRSDMKAAFRNLEISKRHWKFLIMKARSPIDNKIYYFVDKCLPFEASISCSHFQRFSNAVAFILEKRTGQTTINYLDDYLFAALLKLMCDRQVQQFIDLCGEINFPINLDKRFWGTTLLVFLGMLINTVDQTVSVPMDKLIKGLNLIASVLETGKRKITLAQLQKICGFLNFLGRCIIPRRVFTRRLYAYTSGNLKPHYHIRINGEMWLDLEMWRTFLQHPNAFYRPFLDFTTSLEADSIYFYTDASGKIGMGAINDGEWMMQMWDPRFILKYKPNIQCLELYALVATVLQWIHKYSNCRVILFCDNKNVQSAVNDSSTSCSQCMKLIRILVLHCLKVNIKVKVKYIKSKDNALADALSRGKFNVFLREAEQAGITVNKYPTPIPQIVWPMEKIWRA